MWHRAVTAPVLSVGFSAIGVKDLEAIGFRRIASYDLDWRPSPLPDADSRRAAELDLPAGSSITAAARCGSPVVSRITSSSGLLRPGRVSGARASTRIADLSDIRFPGRLRLHAAPLRTERIYRFRVSCPRRRVGTDTCIADRGRTPAIWVMVRGGSLRPRRSGACLAGPYWPSSAPSIDSV
jgi:hypothetical protein